MIAIKTEIIIVVSVALGLVRVVEVVEVIGAIWVAGVEGLKIIEIIFTIENIVLKLALKCDAKLNVKRIRSVRENRIENPSIVGNKVLWSEK